MSEQDRRSFLKDASIGAAALSGLQTQRRARGAAPSGANDRIVMAAIGCGGQGSGLARSFAGKEDRVELACVCDPDSVRAGKLAADVEAKTGNRPEVVADFRRILDNPQIDAVTVATPDHWHAPAAILALDAGKHVYVEKPCSHNIREGRLLVEAARRNQRVCQHGTQSRSSSFIAGAIQMLRDGIIGDVLIAKAWNVQRRRNIGHARPGTPPAEIDYPMWVGPAPFLPYQSNRLHYNWHWWFNFGTGDTGNDGVHDIDYARWGLGVETHPSRVAAIGGKYYFDDDQQFPDTQTVLFEYPGDGSVGSLRKLIWEMRIWSTNYPYNVDSGAEFWGTKGQMVLSKRGKLILFDERNRRVKSPPESALELPEHHDNFLDAIRSGARPAADIEIGHVSATLCHLANIASRLGRTLEFDPQSERIQNDTEANALVRREYQPGHWAIPAGV